VDQLPENPAIADLFEGFEQGSDQFDARLPDLAELTGKVLSPFATEPDADATDTLVAGSIVALGLDRSATLTVALELPLKLAHILDNRRGVDGRRLGENARRAEEESESRTPDRRTSSA